MRVAKSRQIISEWQKSLMAVLSSIYYNLAEKQCYFPYIASKKSMRSSRPEFCPMSRPSTAEHSRFFCSPLHRLFRCCLALVSHLALGFWLSSLSFKFAFSLTRHLSLFSEYVFAPFVPFLSSINKRGSTGLGHSFPRSKTIGI